MIENEPFDKLCFGGHAVLHFHDFDHVEVDWLGGLVDCEDCVDDGDGEGFGDWFGEFGCEGGAGYLQQEISVNRPFNLEFVEKLAVRECDRRGGASKRVWACWGGAFIASTFAISRPSVMTRGWTPSEMYRSDCFINSPTSKHTDVVPSPVISSWLVADRAIIAAVGF